MWAILLLILNITGLGAETLGGRVLDRSVLKGPSSQHCFLKLLDEGLPLEQRPLLRSQGENWIELRQAPFYARADLSEKGVLEIQIYLKDGTERATKLSGKKAIETMVEYFGPKVKALKAGFYQPAPNSHWQDADDYSRINSYFDRLTESGISPTRRHLRSAIQTTWFYQQAVQLGFPVFQIEAVSGDVAYEFEGVEVIFKRGRSQASK